MWSHMALRIKVAKEANPQYEPSRLELMFTPITNCLHDRMTYGQTYAIVDKYMSQNPEDWHYGMANITWDAVSKACGLR